MLKKLGILLLVDLILIWIWISSLHLDPSVGIFIIFVVPTCFAINIIIGLILKAFKKSWANAILINSILSSAICYYIFVYQMNNLTNGSYRNYYFHSDSNTYNILIHQWNGKLRDSMEFETFKVFDGMSMSTSINGKYWLHQDTIILRPDSGRVMKVYKDIMFDFIGKGDTIHLRDKR